MTLYIIYLRKIIISANLKLCAINKVCHANLRFGNRADKTQHCTTLTFNYFFRGY